MRWKNIFTKPVEEFFCTGSWNNLVFGILCKSGVSGKEIDYNEKNRKEINFSKEFNQESGSGKYCDIYPQVSFYFFLIELVVLTKQEAIVVVKFFIKNLQEFPVLHLLPPTENLIPVGSSCFLFVPFNSITGAPCFFNGVTTVEALQ